MNLPKLQNHNEIVLVDDDDIEHLFIRKYFEVMKLNYKLLQFKSGSEFLGYMDKVADGKNQMPALVLLDVRMPDADGFQTLKNLRKHPKFSKIPPVLMFSNSDAPSDIEKAMSLGANGFQTKPTGIKAVDAFFKALLETELQIDA